MLGLFQYSRNFVFYFIIYLFSFKKTHISNQVELDYFSISKSQDIWWIPLLFVESPTFSCGILYKCMWFKLPLFLQACIKRIQGDETGHKHCTGQYFDYWSCIDKCVSMLFILDMCWFNYVFCVCKLSYSFHMQVAPKLFEKLKWLMQWVCWTSSVLYPFYPSTVLNFDLGYHIPINQCSPAHFCLLEMVYWCFWLRRPMN